MFDPVQKSAARAALKRRREEVEQRLAAFGFARGPRRLLRGAGAEEVEPTRARRLRLALESLGPVFSAFGLYLSTRPDLLPARDCLELAAIADRAEPSPLALVDDTFRRETGHTLAGAYSAFDETPFESRLFVQSHYAWLADGRPAVVKVLRHGVAEQAALDARVLHPLKITFAGTGLRDEVIEGALADFVEELRRQTDLTQEAEAMTALARSAEEFEMLGAPAPHPTLRAPGVLTVERLPGTRLDTLLASFDARDGHGAQDWARPEPGPERRQLARQLCLVWLRQALHDQLFPVEPHAANVFVLPGGRVAFTGGTFNGLLPEPRANLWDYLIAVSTDNPDLACSSLLREMKAGGGPEGEDDLRRRFRQLVPRREGQSLGGDDDDLAEHVFAQWHLAVGRGYAPQAHLPGFYRGLCAVARLARRLDPEHDALTQGIQDLRLIAGLGQVRDMMSTQRMGDEMDKYFALMIDLPQRLDQALTLAAEGRARVRLQMPEAGGRRQTQNSTTVVAALLLMLASFVLLSPRLKEPLGAWADGVNALVFLVLGGALLRAMTRA